MVYDGILKGHDRAVNACAVAPDGTCIVSASGDGTLRMWDPDTGETIRVLEGDSPAVWGCAVAPDGSFIVSAAWGGKRQGSKYYGPKLLRTWDPETGEMLVTLLGHRAPVNGCAVAPDGGYIVSASTDRTLRIWDPRTGRAPQSLVDPAARPWRRESRWKMAPRALLVAYQAGERSFVKVDLTGDLTGAGLAGIDLSGAGLGLQQGMKTTQWPVKLAKANLSGAKLVDADLSRAELTGAKLGGATLKKTVMPNGKRHGPTNRASRYTGKP